MRISLTVLLVVVGQALGRWELPIEVLPKYEGKISIFTDNASGVSHVIICDASTKNLLYIRSFPNETVSEPKVFPWKNRCVQPIIKGMHDKKTLYLTFQAQRAATDIQGDCATDPKNCQDIFFTESQDAGETWTAPQTVPRGNQNDKVEREEPQLLVMNSTKIWLFYKRNGASTGNYSYVVRQAGSPYNDFFGKSVLSLYHGWSNDSREYRYYTENNGVIWKSEEVTDYCDDDAIFITPFNSMSTPMHLFVVCKNGEYVDRLKVSTDMGSTWNTYEIPEHTCTDKILVDGDGQGNGYIAYGESTIYLKNFESTYFTRVATPPVPKYNSCRVLTSSYRRTKFWFWFEVMNDDGSFGLWVVWNNLEEEMTE